jgi:hypothetical protein
MPTDKPDLASLLDVLERAWDKWMQDDQQVAFDGPVVVALQDLIIALRAARQPQDDPRCVGCPGGCFGGQDPATCQYAARQPQVTPPDIHEELRKETGADPAEMRARLLASLKPIQDPPPAPQRFWRVGPGTFKGKGRWYWWTVDATGWSLDPDHVESTFATREDAERDARDSGIPEWKPTGGE